MNTIAFPDYSVLDFPPNMEASSHPALRHRIMANIITTTDPNGGNIENLIKEVDRVAKTLPFTIDVTIVEDLEFWQDEKEIKLENKNIHIRIIRYKGSITQQRGILLAVLASKNYDIDMVIDPDMYKSVHAIKELNSIAEGTADIVHFFRACRDGESPVRLIFSKLYTLIFSLFSGTRIIDANSPMVAYKGGLLRNALNNDIGKINPRIFNYIKYQKIKAVPINEPGAPHRSHYNFLNLCRIFITQILQAALIRASLMATSRE